MVLADATPIKPRWGKKEYDLTFLHFGFQGAQIGRQAKSLIVRIAYEHWVYVCLSKKLLWEIASVIAMIVAPATMIAIKSTTITQFNLLFI